MTISAPAPSRTPGRRLRTLGVVTAVAASLLLASTIANLAVAQVERSATAPYGQRVQTSHGALNVVRTPGNGNSEQSIVLLGGLATPAPALDYAPLIRELRNYDVVVVEGFGYGYSDQPAVERTVENITDELHQVLTALNIPRPYVLAGHSIAGFYTLAYANRYRDDVSAVIGIDPTLAVTHSIPAEQNTESGMGINWWQLASATGLLRWATMLAPGLVEPDGNAYTPSERDQMLSLFNRNFGNSPVLDETNRIEENARKVQRLHYPDDLPVLTFLASGEESSADPERYESQQRNVRQHKVVVLPGAHYLHWTQAPAMAAEIQAFLGATSTLGKN
ncbi:MAG: Pimeloyl-ACP methyl ester carboxylesterase [Micrococcaceae bacterium]|jgi:pimeloyl-ACP methyl ester carboxylesterase|nr:Pimeloyl-ACP methyl ester carboxylesterase [Micrococcaceae bacterium]